MSGAVPQAARRNGTHPPGSPKGKSALPKGESAPQDIEAEQSTLGAMLLEGWAIDKARAILGAGDFYAPHHSTLFSIIVALTDQGTPVDLITVKSELEARQALEAVGGITYLTGLLDTVPSSVNIEHYARLVRDRAIQRRAWQWANRLALAAGGEITDVSAFLAAAQEDLERIVQAKPGIVSARRRPLAERIVSLRDVPAPPSELPYLFGPYLNIGASHWLTGQTGIGKSTLLYNLLPALAEGRELWGVPCQPQRVLYVDMESGDIGRSLKVQRLFRDRARPDGLLFAREPIRLPDELPDLLAYIQAQSVSLVVFDTARRCFSVKDENDNAEVYNRVVPTLDALKQNGVATLTMGHPPKNGGFGARGAGAQEDAGDVNLTLTMHRGEVTDNDGIIKLAITKNRLLGLSIPPLLLRRAGEDLFEAVTAEAAGAPNIPVRQETPQERACQEILCYLNGHPLGSATFSAIMEEMKTVGISESTAKRALKSLEETGRLTLTSTRVYVLNREFTEGSGEQGSDEL